MAFTFFFRDNHTLEQAIKYFMPIVAGYQKVRIWDAGCAMGPEPYTLAIMLAETMGYFAFKNLEIDATDIDETGTFGPIITQGIYLESDLARIPPDILEKYFHRMSEPDKFLVDEKVRSKIKFYQNDLLDLKPLKNNYNLILCKNVLLHLLPDERIKVIRMFHSALATNGLLATEQTQPMPEETAPLFKKLANDANIYQKI
jgi:chemotaxis protein methyltransferase CheR